ncbi:hypothetical protein [Caudoviricetes sp.]|nr:hypothetical protein [Caudoviricetes sp.]
MVNSAALRALAAAPAFDLAPIRELETELVSGENAQAWRLAIPRRVTIRDAQQLESMRRLERRIAAGF